MSIRTVGVVAFIDCPGFYVAGPKVRLPDDAVLYPSDPSHTVREHGSGNQWHRFVVQSGDALGVGHRLVVFDRTMPIRWASDDGSGPLNPVPVTTLAAAAHLIKGRLAVASTPPASPPAGGVDGAAGPDVDAPGNAGDASPAASVPGMVGEQSRPGGPAPELEAGLARLEAAVSDLFDMHRADDHRYCFECDRPWPCSTYRRLAVIGDEPAMVDVPVSGGRL